jgi:uncharacterized protein YodC (DUF2158 family)
MKVGDLVFLRSGGPQMTVVSVSELTPEEVVVAWFSEDEKELHSAAVNETALVPTG